MRTELRRRSDARRSGGDGRVASLLDHLGPAVVVVYIVLQFGPLVRLIDFPGALSSIGFSVAAMGALLLTPPERLRRVPVSFSLFTLLAWAVLSMAWSLYPHGTAFLIRGQLFPIALLVLVAGTIPPRTLVRTLVATLVAIAVFSLVTSVVWSPGRAATLEVGVVQLGFRGGFIHKNLLGVFMVMTLAMALPFVRPPMVNRLGRSLMLSIIVVTSVATRSATAAGGLVVVALLWFWMSSMQQLSSRRERRRLVAFSLAAVVAGVAVVIGALPTLLSLYDKDLTLSGRTTIWTESLETIGDEPLVGYGYGGIFDGPIHPVTQDLWDRIEFGVPHAHNGLVEIALELGLVGVALVLFVLIQLFRVGAQCLRHPETRAHGQWVLLTVTSLIVMSMAEPLLQGPHLAWLAVVWTAAKRTLSDLERKPESVSPR